MGSAREKSRGIQMFTWTNGEIEWYHIGNGA